MILLLEARMKWRLDPGQIEVVDPAVAAVLRRKTVTERVAMILEANQTMRRLIEGPLRSRHPDWSEEQFNLTDIWKAVQARASLASRD
jgi:hypothetical protein